MKHTYLISGLDCPNCALKLEKQISKVEGVNSCSINFLANKLDIDISNDCMGEVKTICSNFEDGVSLKRIK